MQRFYDVITDQFGNPANGVLVTVYDAATGTPSTLYRDSDNSLTATNVISNPFTTNASGIVAFAVANGQYTITYSGSSITPRTFTWVTLNDGISTSIPWSGVTGTPTTLSGYGVTDNEFFFGDGATTTFNLGRAKPHDSQLVMNWGQPVIPYGVTWQAFGDSITSGSYYASGLASARTLTITNNAVSGSQAADQTVPIFALSVGANQLSTYFVGTNDQRFYNTNASKQQIFRWACLDALAWLAIPETSKLRASSGSITYTGSWSAGNYSSMARVTSTNGDHADFSLTGNTVYISMKQLNGDTGTYTISIDAVSKGTFATSPGAAVNTNNGITYAPRLHRFTELSSGAHTIVITKTSAGGTVELNWAAGKVTTDVYGPRVVACNLYRLTTTGYLSGGSDATVAQFNSFISYNAFLLKSDGLNVFMADVSSLDPYTETTDGIHPNSTGSARISKAFQGVVFNNVRLPLYFTTRTNNVTNSMDLSTSWTTTAVTINSNAISAPDGTLTADKLEETAVNSDHRIYKSQTFGAGKTFSASCFAKAAERSFLRIVVAGDFGVVYDLTNQLYKIESGTNGVVKSARIEPWGNGWYRLCCTWVSNELSTANLQFALATTITPTVSYLGVLGSGMYLWGCELKEGELTPFVPTTSAAASVIDYTFTESGGTVFSTAPPQGSSVYWVSSDVDVSSASPLTLRLAQITHTAPTTADYAIQNLTNASGYGFVTQDEGNTVLSVVKNLQVRLDGIESKLQSMGVLL